MISDKRNPRLNANDTVYGSPEESTDMVPVLNPIHEQNLADQASLPRSEHAILIDYLTATPYTGATSPLGWPHYIHNQISTKRGAFGLPRIRAQEGPTASRLDLLRPRSLALDTSMRQLSMYDPKTGRFPQSINAQHLYFGHDASNALDQPLAARTAA